MACEIIAIAIGLCLVGLCANNKDGLPINITIKHVHEAPEPMAPQITQEEYDKAMEEQKAYVDAAQALQKLFLDDDEEVN